MPEPRWAIATPHTAATAAGVGPDLMELGRKCELDLSAIEPDTPCPDADFSEVYAIVAKGPTTCTIPKAQAELATLGNALARERTNSPRGHRAPAKPATSLGFGATLSVPCAIG